MGAVPAYSLYGRPATDSRLAHMDGARLAAPSAPYLGRGNLCSANDDTCEGRKAQGTEFCYGHLRSLGLVKQKGAVHDGDGSADVDADSE
jgi:hypothetical protein